MLEKSVGTTVEPKEQRGMERKCSHWISMQLMRVIERQYFLWLFSVHIVRGRTTQRQIQKTKKQNQNYC